jgi:hypothetical protein
LAALVLLAGCGERRQEPGAGTEGAAVTDTQQPAPADAAVAVADTAASTRGGSADTAAVGRDTAARQQAQRQPAPVASKPAKPAERAPAETSTTAPAQTATPAPAEPPQAPAPATPKPSPPAQAAAPAPAAQDTTPEDTAAAPDTAPSPTAAAQDTGAAPKEDTGTTETAVAPLRDQYHQAPRDTVDQATYDGWKQYNLNCARCHGEDVLGSTIAPHLIMSLKPDGPINTQESFVQVVCAGRPELGMPSWCALGMEPATINKVYAYVKGRSEGKIGPGRPALKPEG